eukprot:1188091-Prorocentrum_minimum.AAC.1
MSGLRGQACVNEYLVVEHIRMTRHDPVDESLELLLLGAPLLVGPVGREVVQGAHGVHMDDMGVTVLLLASLLQLASAGRGWIHSQ